jgi:hypothetical protein
LNLLAFHFPSGILYGVYPAWPDIPSPLNLVITQKSKDSLSSMGLDLVEVGDLSIGSISSARVRLKGICESDLPHTSIPRVQVVDHIYCQLDPIQFSLSTLRPSVLRMKKSKKSKNS